MNPNKLATLLLFLISSLLLILPSNASAVEAMVSAGREHSLALKKDGTVWSWGKNTQGQLGDGSVEHSLTPVQVNNLEVIISIAAGSDHSLALKSDGTVWAWGDNDFGQLGNNSDVQQNTPVQVQQTSGAPLDSVIFVAAGGYHSLALKNDGSVWVWGNNEFGQLGDNSTTTKFQALQLTSLNNISAIAGGNSHSLALGKNGTVWAWGYNDDQQLGDGTSTDRHIPVLVQDGGGNDLSSVTAISANLAQSFALLQNSTVKSWGKHIGSTPTTMIDSKSNPIQSVNMLADGKGNHILAIKTDGTVWAGGYNGYGQLGNNSSITKAYGVQVRGSDGLFIKGAMSIAAGEGHSLALLASGKIASWGDNRYGQLGTGLEQDSSYPVKVIKTDTTPISSATQISAGKFHGAALLNDFTVMSWARNTYGSLANDNLENSSKATQVLQAGGTPLTGIDQVSSGEDFTMALKNDGTVWAWGLNNYGQLGNNTTTDTNVPVQVLCVFPVSQCKSEKRHWIKLN
jgi:alpha-tubulin suppressor-like RCC1 family protein